MPSDDPSPLHPSSPSGRSLTRRDFIRAASAGALAAGLGLRARADTDQVDSRKLGVVLLGLGRYAHEHLAPALVKHTKRCYLAGAISGHPDKLAAWGKEFNLNGTNLYTYDTMDRIIDNPDVDIIYVVTPPGVRREFVERAAAAGKHVIAEKPLATTVEDCDAMIAACRAAKVKFSVGYRLHFDPYHQELMRLARDGDFGAFTKMTGNRGFIFGNRAWRIDKKLGGGGPLMDLGIYIIHGACMAAQAAPVAVTAHELPKKKPELFNDVEEAMSFQLHFADGAVCDAVAGFNHVSDTFKAEGAKGWIDFQQHAFTYSGIKCVTSRGPLSYPPPDQQALQMDDFAECVATGRDTSVPGELGRRDIRILSAIYEAAATGKKVAV